MTTTATYGILLDILLWMGGAVALALPMYSLLRSMDPAVAWSGGGKVGVKAIRTSDLPVAVVLAGLFWLAMVYSPYLSELKGGGGPSASPGMSPMVMVKAQMMTTFLAAMLFLFMTAHRGESMKAFFFGRSNSLLGNAGVAVAVLLLSIYVMGFSANSTMEWMRSFWPTGDQQGSVKMIQQNHAEFGLQDRALLFFAIAILAPLTEEMIFRGFLYPVLKRFTNRWFSMIVVSLFFASIHSNIPAFLPLFLLAIGFTLAYEFTGSLLTPVIMHALFNGQELVLLLRGPG